MCCARSCSFTNRQQYQDCCLCERTTPRSPIASRCKQNNHQVHFCRSVRFSSLNKREFMFVFLSYDCAYITNSTSFRAGDDTQPTNDRPRSRYLLTFVRADFVQLRVLARSLVLWAQVAPTHRFVRSHAPPYMLAALDLVFGSPPNAGLLTAFFVFQKTTSRLTCRSFVRYTKTPRQRRAARQRRRRP